LISSLDGYGESRSLRQLAEQQRAAGSLVRIVALSAECRIRHAVEAAGVACRALQRRWPYDPIAAWRLARELREPTYDLLHVWDLGALRYANFVRSRSNTAPCVATLSRIPQGKFEVDCFVVPDPRQRGEENTVVIPPGVASPTSDPLPRAEFLKLLSLPADSQIIAIAGKLTRSRGLEEDIWCFELLRTLDERARLLLFGAGPDRHRLERFSRLASEPNAIRFLGYQDDLEPWLPHIEVFWQLSDEQSLAGPPLAALEAMAAGVPVVATDLPAHRQMIEAGRTGFLFPVASRALCARHTMRLLQGKEFALTIAKAASEEVARCFSLTSHLDGYKELYNQLTSS